MFVNTKSLTHGEQGVISCLVGSSSDPELFSLIRFHSLGGNLESSAA